MRDTHKKLKEGEPFLTLMARDVLAAPLTKLWAELSERLGVQPGEKVVDALDIAQEMDAWRMANGVPLFDGRLAQLPPTRKGNVLALGPRTLKEERYVVSVRRPAGLSQEDMEAYIEEAVATWAGSQDPESPLFELYSHSRLVVAAKFVGRVV